MKITLSLIPRFVTENPSYAGPGCRSRLSSCRCSPSNRPRPSQLGPTTDQRFLPCRETRTSVKVPPPLGGKAKLACRLPLRLIVRNKAINRFDRMERKGGPQVDEVQRARCRNGRRCVGSADIQRQVRQQKKIRVCFDPSKAFLVLVGLQHALSRQSHKIPFGLEYEQYAGQ